MDNEKLESYIGWEILRILPDKRIVVGGFILSDSQVRKLKELLCEMEE